MFIWPFNADVERTKGGGHHWAYDYSRKATFIVAPRYPDSPPRESGWAPRETRYYEWKNCMAIHTAGAWEDPQNPAKIWVESSRVHDNAFPFFPTDDGRVPAAKTKADYVRWEFDLTCSTGTYLADPEVVLDVEGEFPRIDERWMTRRYDVVFLNVLMMTEEKEKNIYHGLNGLAMHLNKTHETRWFYAGQGSLIQEPVFIPRAESAVEGDGWVMAMIERVEASRCDIVIIDTREFEKPIAIVQLPFHMKAQVHGNWVSAKDLGGHKPLVKQIEEFEMLKQGALEPL